jgi:flagellar basal-body rod modification protein FlgD
MNTQIRNQIAPPTSVASQPMMDVATKENEKATDSTTQDKIEFRDLLSNSNAEVQRERSAKIKGDYAGATKDEFFKKLEEDTQGEIKAPKNKLDKDDFLRLFVEQLKHQDPLNPDDGAELATKLAQFNSVEQLMAVNKSLADMSASQTTDKAIAMTDFIGKELAIRGGRMRMENGRPTDTEFILNNAASNATLEVRDETGRIVHEQELGSRLEGNHKVNWDGKNKFGIPLANGVYTYNVLARDMNGESIPVDIKSKVKVIGVDIMDKDGLVFTDYGRVKFTDVQSIGLDRFEERANGLVSQSGQALAAEPIVTDNMMLDENGQLVPVVQEGAATSGEMSPQQQNGTMDSQAAKGEEPVTNEQEAYPTLSEASS